MTDNKARAMESAADLPFIVSSSTHLVKLAKTYLRVLQLLPAGGDTFVLLVVRGVNRDAIVHCNQEGTILFEHEFKHGVNGILMLNT